MRGITDIALSFNETEETRQYIHIKWTFKEFET
jgi:hypothetical protein